MKVMLSTEELKRKLAGGDCFIRTKDGEVKGLALRPDMNPQAPKRVIVGTGPEMVRRAKLIVDCNKAVPVYMKRGTNKWQYMGYYRATVYRRDEFTVKQFKCNRADVDGILFLEVSER